jgi:hypothetical protein
MHLLAVGCAVRSAFRRHGHAWRIVARRSTMRARTASNFSCATCSRAWATCVRAMETSALVTDPPQRCGRV